MTGKIPPPYRVVSAHIREVGTQTTAAAQPGLTHFAIIAWDRPDSATLRAAARDAHFARIEEISDVLAIAGPMNDEAGKIIGSLVVVVASTKAEALAILKADPYYSAVWERFEIHDFKPVVGRWINNLMTERLDGIPPRETR